MNHTELKFIVANFKKEVAQIYACASILRFVQKLSNVFSGKTESSGAKHLDKLVRNILKNN